MLRKTIPLLLALALIAACASAPGTGVSKAGIGAGNEGTISRAELQDSLLRFEMSFNESLRDAFSPVAASSSTALRVQALRNWLAYTSSSLAIALGPVPESNLLDMMVFLELSGKVFETHWMPKLYGERGKPVLAAFKRGEADLDQIALKVVTPDQIKRFHEAIERWRTAHPNQFAVEGIRLTQIAAETGAAAADLQAQASGLMANIKRATLAADQVSMLGERFLYYAERLPFLARVQARVGAQEILGDSAGIAGAAGGFLNDGTVAFREATRAFTLLHQDLTLVAGSLVAMAVVLFLALVFLAVRLRHAVGPIGSSDRARERRAQWLRQKRQRGSGAA